MCWGARLGFPTQEGSIYSESLRGFMHKNSIFIDRETVLNPQENTDSRSEDIFSFGFQKITFFRGLVCACVAIFISLSVSKMHYSCALFAAFYHYHCCSLSHPRDKCDWFLRIRILPLAPLLLNSIVYFLCKHWG